MREFDVNVRPDCTREEYAVAVAGHFQGMLEAREDEVRQSCLHFRATRRRSRFPALSAHPRLRRFRSSHPPALRRRRHRHQVIQHFLYYISMKPPFDQSEGQANGARAAQARQQQRARARKSAPQRSSSTKRGRDSSDKSGRIPNGRLVVAKVDDTWILARVLSYRNGDYEVMDEDDSDDASKVSKVKSSDIAQLYESEDQRIDPITVGERVLALFPGASSARPGVPPLSAHAAQRAAISPPLSLSLSPHIAGTSAFYPGNVLRLPLATSRRKEDDAYYIQFDDDVEDDEIIEHRKIGGVYVIKFPGQTQKRARKRGGAAAGRQRPRAR